jgi:hypothetical protein
VYAFVFLIYKIHSERKAQILNAQLDVLMKTCPSVTHTCNKIKATSITPETSFMLSPLTTLTQRDPRHVLVLIVEELHISEIYNT